MDPDQPWVAYLEFLDNGTLQIKDEELFKRFERELSTNKPMRFKIWWKYPSTSLEGSQENKVNVMCPC